MKRICVILLLCCCVLHVAAQRYSFYNLGVENGLIQSQVRALAQDTYGHLWVGTLGGMSRYDGSHFTNYNARNGMLDNNVTAIATDNTGNIWVGGPDGLSCYNGKRFTHYSLHAPDNSSPRTVKKIIPGSGNTLWCHTDRDVFSVHDKKVSQLPLPDSNLTITAIYPSKDTLWVATNKGCIYRYHNKTWDSIFFNFPGIPKAPITTLHFLKDRKERLLLATGNGLFYIKQDSVKAYRVSGTPLINIPFISIAQAKDGAIWLGTFSGAYRVTDSTLMQYTKKSGFTDNTVNAILSDNEGNIWLGSEGQGLFRYSGGQFSILDERSSLPSEQIMSFAPTPSGKLYLGTSDAGLFFYDNLNIIPIPLQKKDVYVSSLHADGEYDIWIGTGGNGLWRLKGPERIYYNTPEMPPNATVISLYKDTSRRLWIGTGNGVTYFYNNKFTKVSGVGGNVLGFGIIGNDSIIVAATRGMFLYHAGTLTAYKTGTATDSCNPQCLLVQGNNIWIGTNDNGVLCYNTASKKCLVLNKSNGLQSDFIYNIVADKKGGVWVGTGYGIHKIQLSNNKAHVTFYGKDQGITGMESNQNASCRMPDGTLWFGTTKGAVHIDPDRKLTLPQPTSIVLQSVKVFGDDIHDSTYYDSLDNWYNVPYKLALPYQQNNITFTFKGITLSGSEQLMYRYRIDGLDAPWSDWTPINSVTYSALPPGKYTLQVESRTINSDDIKTLSYAFEIITPFHKTTWFSLLILGACILAGISIQYILNRRKQNRLALVEKLRREEQSKVRQRTAEDFHDEVGNKLTRINVLTNVLKEKLGDVTPDKKRIIEQIQENTAQLYSGTKDILWSLQSTNDSLYEILHRIRDFGADLFADTSITFEFSGTDNTWQDYRLPLDMSRNLIMIYKEALNNSLKYSGATKILLEAELQDNVLHITLVDNGKGFNVEEVVKGNGLNNMRNRAERLKGKLYIDSHAGQGTSINLHFRLPGKSR